MNVVGPDKFRCDHCSLVFVYDRRTPAPAPPAPTPRPPPSSYAPPPSAAPRKSVAGVVITVIVFGVILGTVVPIILVVHQVTNDAQQAANQATRPRESSSSRSSTAPTATPSPPPLPCEQIADRYRACLVENEDHEQDDARAQVESLRRAARDAIDGAEAENEETACAAQFEARLERCENRGGLLGRFTRPSTEVDPDEQRPSLLSRLRGGDAEEEHEPEPPVDLARYQALSGCDCGGGKKGPRIELNIAVQGNKTVMGDPAYEFVDYTMIDWVLTRDGEPWRLPATMTTAPPEGLPGWRSSIGFACSDDTVVMASVRHVSAWSLSERKHLWTTELADPFGDELGLGRRNSYQLNCSSLSVRRDVIEIPLDRRRKLRLGLADGKAR